MRWTVHVARKGERKCVHDFGVEISSLTLREGETAEGDRRGNRRLEKTTHWVASWSALVTKCYPDDKISTNEMDGACGT